MDFPLYHIVNAFDACFVPQTQGAGWSPDDLVVIAAWTVAGLVGATRRLRKESEAG
jgi:hypothetical protein